MQKEPMTKFGFDKIAKELEHLKNVERIKVAEEIAEARSHGDLSENAEYDAAKEKQALLEKRIGQLSDMLSRAQVIDPSVLKHERVCFGSTAATTPHAVNKCKLPYSVYFDVNTIATPHYILH